MKRFLWGMLSLLFLLQGPGVRAAEVFSLERCLSLALKRYPALKAALARREAAYRRAQATSRNRLPRLYARYTYRRYRDLETIGTPFGTFPLQDYEEAALGISVQWPVFHGLALSVKRALRNLEVDLAEVEERRVQQELRLRVKEAYFELVKAEKLLELARKSLERRQAHWRDVEGFFKEGLVGRVQWLQARAELREAEYRLLSAENQLEVARARLNFLLQRPLKAPLKVVPVFPARPLKTSYPALLEQALKIRPEIQAARLAVHLKEKELALVRSRYFPWIDVEVQYYKRGDSLALSENPYGDRENLWVGVRLDWELWDWGQRRQEIAASRAEILAQEALLKEMEETVRLEVREAYLALISARKRVEVARSALTAAKEHFRLTRERFREGLADTSEVLDAETLLTRAQTQEISARADYEIARARLAYAVGLPEVP